MIKIHFSTTNDPANWVAEGSGVIKFASDLDATMAEKLFHEIQGKLKDAIYLLEVCRGCDLMYDAWPAFGVGSVVHGVTITNETPFADVVDAFLGHRDSGDAAEEQAK